MLKCKHQEVSSAVVDELVLNVRATDGGPFTKTRDAWVKDGESSRVKGGVSSFITFAYGWLLVFAGVFIFEGH
jgi:hypothetical protein